MLKKSLAIGLSVVMAAEVLTGCSGGFGRYPASRSRRPATELTGSEKQIAPAFVPGPAFSLIARMIAAFSSA